MFKDGNIRDVITAIRALAQGNQYFGAEEVKWLGASPRLDESEDKEHKDFQESPAQDSLAGDTTTDAPPPDVHKKKKKGKYNPLPSATPPPKAAPLVSKPDPTSPLSVPVNSVGPLTFDSLEDKIRGEEAMLEQENRKLRESQEIKKKLQESEVEKKLDELRRQLGLPKK